MKTFLCFALFATFLFPCVAEEAVKLPSPKTASHPYAKEVPESSPLTYSDNKGFAERIDLLMKGLSSVDLGSYRRGYFSGGDPGKYVPAHVIARLLTNKDTDAAREIMNDDRSYKEHYHFAAVSWSRFYPLFGETQLTEATRGKFIDKGFRYGSYLNPSGTENHKTMSMTSANVLPWYTGKGLSNKSKEETLTQAKEMLRKYVKGLYMAGQGEWDSSTYLMFDVNGMLNIYDFSKDEECRLLAKAALDWFMTAYALKYTDGVYCAPNQRGFAKGPMASIADQSGWLWWGASKQLKPDDLRSFRYAVHPATSSWRPNEVICRIATRKSEILPVEQRNTKPNYWYGQRKPWQQGAYEETLYIHPQYTIGSLQNGFGGQITRFQIVAKSKNGGRVFTGGHPRKSDHTGKIGGISYRDGLGRYEQIGQSGPVVVVMNMVPDEEKVKSSFFALPTLEWKERVGKWFAMRSGEAFVGLYPLGDGIADWYDVPLSAKELAKNKKDEKKGKAPRYKPLETINIQGQKSGFVVIVAGENECKTNDDFKKLLEKVGVDDSLFNKDTKVLVSYPGRESFTMTFNPDKNGVHGNKKAICLVSGKERPELKSVYSGKLCHQEDGVLTVSDGRKGFVVDFSGDLPVYRGLKK